MNNNNSENYKIREFTLYDGTTRLSTGERLRPFRDGDVLAVACLSAWTAQNPRHSVSAHYTSFSLLSPKNLKVYI